MDGEVKEENSKPKIKKMGISNSRDYRVGYIEI